MDNWGGFQSEFEQYSGNIKNRVEKVMAAGDLIVVQGVWDVTQTPKGKGDKEPIEDSGYWIDIMQLQNDGAWKTVQTMWVSERPVPGSGGK